MSIQHRPLIGILSDDLTSAADGAAPFVVRGLSASVGRACLPLAKLDVVAIDAGTRSLALTAAIERCRVLTAHLRHAKLLYKTVDSTLRGHVKAEIDAVLKASRRERLVFAPAYPHAGRTTANGIQLVDGVPVDCSSYSNDPVHPAATSRLAELIPAEARNVLLLDAATQEELNQKVAEIKDPFNVLWVGSPGLAEALAARFPKMPAAHSTSIVRDVLVVVGSANPISHAQADEVERHPEIRLLRAPQALAIDSAATLRALTNDAVRALQTERYGAVLATGGDTMEAILDALGIDQFVLLGEVESGFPVGAARHGDRDLVLGMKAGGFGHPQTLVQAARRLSSKETIF